MDDLEQMLKRYRPAGPDPELRQRVIAAASSRSAERVALRRVCEWLPAAAALVFALVFYWLAATERQVLDARFPPVPPSEQQTIDMEAPL